MIAGSPGALQTAASDLRQVGIDLQDAAAAGALARQAALDGGVPTTAADDDVRVGHAQMVSAVGRAERANADAATKIDALTERLRDRPAEKGPRDRVQEVKDLVGGAGETAWDSLPGLVGSIYDAVPLAPYQALSDGIDDTHDFLEDWWSADTESDQYVAGKGGAELASMLGGFGALRKALQNADELAGAAAPAVGFAEGTAASALTSNRLPHAARHLTDAGLLPPWSGKRSPGLMREMLTPILERPSATFDHKLGEDPVRGFVGEVDGRTVAVFVFKEGPYQSQLATAYVPTAQQLKNWGVS